MAVVDTSASDPRQVCAEFDGAIAEAAAVVLPAYESRQRWRDRIRAGIAALLRFLDENPRAKQLFIMESLDSALEALERRTSIERAVIRAIRPGP
jgi:hypothetical protein